jgi:Uri superfamily endonuclease
MRTLDRIPPRSGTYILEFHLGRDRNVRVGALGSLKFSSGVYLYVGSALGPGGLRARLKHHLSMSPRPHWHADYLRRYSRLSSVWLSMGTDRRECSWTGILSELPQLDSFGHGFGSSDCRCPSHLLRVVGPASQLRRTIGEHLSQRAVHITI